MSLEVTKFWIAKKISGYFKSMKHFFKTAIYPETLALLKSLMKDEELKDFRLAGGTAIALHCGHRISYDLDFFTELPIQRKILTTYLIEKYNCTINTSYDYFISGFIIFKKRNIKVDFVKYYPWVEKSTNHNNLRLASLEELAAMKLQAITNRGKRRDFYDIFILLKHFSIQEFQHLYSKKFPDGNFALVLKSLEYTVDADKDDENLTLFFDESWTVIKQQIKAALRKFYKL